MTTTEQLYAIFQQYPTVTTDSRHIVPGVLFFALKGANFDGNAFAKTALEAGAAYAIVDDPACVHNDRCLLVPDVLTALQDLARHHRRQFDMPFIAITGSNGKTTTKELVAAVMSQHYNTLFTQGNFNNHIGVPLTLLKVRPEHEVAIIEMGANHQGEIHDLCAIAEPTHGLITNMGKAHLEGFGGEEGVRVGKSELYRWLGAHRGTIFVNESEAHLSQYIPEKMRPILYQQTDAPSLDTPQYQAQLLASDPFLKVGFLNEKGELLETPTHLVGLYNFNNILTAIAVGKYFKVPAAKIQKAIETYQPNMNRSQVVAYKTATLILDAYNANPSSMREALINLSKMPFAQKIAIIGDMRELGEATAAEHTAILALADTLGLTQIVTVGTAFEAVNHHHTAFSTTEKAREWFDNQEFTSETCCLIKGSRGMKLETLLG